jgi:hypothetical protein
MVARCRCGVDRMRERLLAKVRARLESFAESHDPVVVLNPAALEEVAALIQATPDLAADAEIAHAAGWLRWCRYLVLGDQPDLAAALRLLELVYRVQPVAVPGPVGEFFAADGRAWADDPAAAAGLGLRLLEHAFRVGDRAGLDRGIDLLRQAVNAAPGHESQIGWV